ncbi:hypothetical protein AB3X91_03525 [Paraburkholderia sp. BR14263]
MKLDEIKKLSGLLAKWFRFQPSEIDDLTIDEFIGWCETACEQIDAANGK